jgi:glycosyltransferase involved in cell wall biosynthesis
LTPSSPPQLSVLIATHNRFELLERCIAALKAQTQDPADFELIVADDGSSDGTAAKLEALQTPFELLVLQLEKAGKPVVLNAAIEAARGEVCLFLDDDIIASPGLVAEHLAAHRREPKTLGIGALVQRESEGEDWFVQTFTRAWNDHYEELRRRPARWTDCYGANFSAPRGTLVEIGGFSSEVATVEDFDIAYRLRGAGLRITYVPRASAVHDDQKPRSRMLADLRREGAAYVEFAERHPGTAAELLDWAAAAGPVELRLRRLLIALRVPPSSLAALGSLIPGPGRKMIWLHVIRRLAFWRSVRGAVDRRRWLRITGGKAAGGTGRYPAETAP